MKATFMKLARRGAIAVVAAGLVWVADDTRADTLADALVGAYGHSGLLEQNRALLRAADEDVATAVAALRPIINWTADVTRDFGTDVSTGRFSVGRRDLGQTTASLGLVAQLLLWDDGAVENSGAAAKETVLATRQTLIGIEQQILLRAISAFMSVREAAEFVALRQNNTRLLTEELRAAKDRFEVGEVTRTDVALAEAALAEARSGLAQAEGGLVLAQEEYINAVGRRPGTLATPPRLPRLDNDVVSAKALAVRVHPDLKSVQHQVAASELRILAAQGQMSPKVNLTGRVNLIEDLGSRGYTHAGSVGVEVTGPVYRGGQLSSAVRKAIAQRDAGRANLYVVQHNIRQNVGNAYAQFAAAQASLQASDQRIQASRIAFRGVREEAQLGARTTLDVLNAEQQLLNAEASRIQAQTQLYVAAYQVLAATGRLTATDLGLKVPQYDPAAYYNIVKDAPTARSKQGRKLDRVLRALQKE